MNTRLQRNYYILRTTSGDAIGLVALIEHMVQTTVTEFSLFRPERSGTDQLFVDLVFTAIDFAEFETHRDAFQTHVELDVVKEWTANGITSVMVQQKEGTDEKD